ncbi:MAG: glycosyltransferase [Pirellulales bacterium]
MLVHVLVLNYNGRRLLAECLPSVLAAAAASRHDCRVAVLDNDSSDGSASWLRQTFPEVEIFACRNEGLASYNRVLPRLDGTVALLLNNDIKLSLDDVQPAVNPIDALVQPLLGERAGRQHCFMSAPCCYQFDAATLEGFKTAVQWRYGLVQATGRFAGAEACATVPDWTASAGAALAVQRELFVALGGFDPLYFPGRIEDLDFAFRGYMAGHHAVYVPDSVVYHRGAATFGRAFGAAGNDHLALRNTLLFQWKNLRHPRHLVRMALGWPLRLAVDLLQAPLVPSGARLRFARACWQAAGCWRRRSTTLAARRNPSAERTYFARFHPRAVRRRATWYRLSERAETTTPRVVVCGAQSDTATVTPTPVETVPSQ